MARPPGDIEPRIVRSARARFLAAGVDGASLRSIAQDAGTNVGMIYYYFPTKDDLFLAVVESAYARLVDDIVAVVGREAPAEDRIAAIYHRLADLDDEAFDVVRIIAREALISSTRLQKLFTRFTAGHVPPVLRLLGEGLGDGTLDPAVGLPGLIAGLASTAIFPQLLRRRIVAEVPQLAPLVPEAHALAETLFQVYMRGVAKRPQ